MDKLIAFIDQHTAVTVLYPANVSGVRLQNLYESGMQVPQQTSVNIEPYFGKLVVLSVQTISGTDAYGVTVLESNEAGPELIDVINGNEAAAAFTESREAMEADAEAAALPKNFNELRNLPAGANFERGIDISHHNNIPNWTAIKDAGVRFVYIKMSEGVGTPDRKAKINATQAKQNGFKIGYYHFGRPDKRNGGTVIADAIAEANEVKNLLGTLPTADLPLMLDLEDSTVFDSPLAPADYLLWVETFLGTFFNAADPNNAPLIYSRKNYLDTKLPATHTLGQKYRLWLSRYTPDFTKAIAARGWSDWNIWQFTEAGVLGGNSELDLNIRKL